MSLSVEKLNPIDPFEIDLPIFNPGISKYQKIDYQDLHNDFYCSWLKWVYDAELESSIIYPIISQRIKNSTTNTFLDDLDSNNKQIFCDYLNKMGQEEGEHFDHFSDLLYKTYGKQVSDILDPDYVNTQKSLFTIKGNSTDPFLLLLWYYGGECYFWSAYYLFYKNTRNDHLQKIIKTLLVEEAQHNNRIYKIFKTYKDQICFDSNEFVETCKQYRYLNLCFVQSQFDINEKMKDKFIVNNIYHSDLQKSFNDLAIKKWHQLYSIFNPHVDVAKFTTLVNN